MLPTGDADHDVSTRGVDPGQHAGGNPEDPPRRRRPWQPLRGDDPTILAVSHRVQDIAGGEHAALDGAQRGVDEWTLGGGVEASSISTPVTRPWPITRVVRVRVATGTPNSALPAMLNAA
jgi:hypothetical protein